MTVIYEGYNTSFEIQDYRLGIFGGDDEKVTLFFLSKNTLTVDNELLKES